MTRMAGDVLQQEVTNENNLLFSNASDYMRAVDCSFKNFKQN